MTCDGNRKCVNADGFFEFVCDDGYKYGGINYFDIDDCLDYDDYRHFRIILMKV